MLYINNPTQGLRIYSSTSAVFRLFLMLNQTIIDQLNDAHTQKEIINCSEKAIAQILATNYPTFIKECFNLFISIPKFKKV